MIEIVTAPTAAAQTRRLAVRVSQTAPAEWNHFAEQFGYAGYFQRVEWLNVLRDGLQQQPWFLSAWDGDQLVGVLPLAFVKSALFGRFLVSLPYLNTAGVVTKSNDAAVLLVDEAIRLADRLDVKNLELRHETEIEHAGLPATMRQKVHMRLPLPETTEALWSSLKSKVRSQIKKPRNDERLTVAWGREDLLDEFHRVFCANMRDLGTPPFSRKLFGAMLAELPDDTEICCVRFDGTPCAGAFIVHGPDVTTVPSASSLRSFNRTSCNMLMYWHLLSRSIERGQRVFDFGRSSEDSGTFRFKKQWGSEAQPAVWQYYLREGAATDMRPEGGRYGLMIKAWQKLPVWVTKIIGPSIVRGIP